MNEVDRQVAELQAQSGNKTKQEYSVEVESEDIASPTEENEIEIPQEKKTFEVESDNQEEPVVEDKSKQEEVEEPKEDSKNKYSKSVQKRFDEYAYQLGESRRREEEAIAIAQAIKAERDKIKDELGKLNSGYVNEMGGRLTGSMEAAKAKLKKAMEDQDYDAVANAQFEIGKLSTEQSRYEQIKAQQEALANAPKQEREIEIPKVQPQQPVKDPKAESWAEKNEWFGTDKVMTNVAYAIHEDLVNQGVDPRTDYYYSEIDKRMRENLPHKFEQNSSSEEPARQQPVQTVASAHRNRGTGRNVVKLSSSEAAIAKRLGLSNEQYASEKLKLQRR
jgi:hypothetical protein